MKHFLILALGVFLTSSSLTAQTRSSDEYTVKKEKRTQLLNAFIDTNHSHSKQNADLNDGLASETYQYYNNESWSNTSRVLFTYDNSANSYVALHQLYYFESWLDFSKNEYDFTSEGYPLENTYFESSGISFQESSNTIYHYASDNKIDSVVFTETDEGVFYKDVSFLNYITADSIFVQEISYEDGEYTATFKGSIVQKNGNLVITYDDTRDTYYDISFDGFIKDVHTFSEFQSYLYEEKNSSEEWVPIEKDIYVKENGKFISGEFSVYENDAWTLEIKHNFNYEYNRLTSVVDSSFYGEYIDIDRTLYDYNEPVSNEAEELVTRNFSLLQNYPNPFNPVTTIPYTLNSTQKVTLNV